MCKAPYELLLNITDVPGRERSSANPEHDVNTTILGGFVLIQLLNVGALGRGLGAIGWAVRASTLGWYCRICRWSLSFCKSFSLCLFLLRRL